MTPQTVAAEEDTLIDGIVRRYDGEEGMLIPMMQDLQAECGYLSASQLCRLAERIGLPLSRLYAVATFYASFRLAPKGRHEVTLCVGTVCYLKGSGEISEMIQQDFKVEAGGTTPDGRFSFQPVNCVGACALAPVMIVDDQYHDGVSTEQARKILTALPMDDDSPAPKEDGT